MSVPWISKVLLRLKPNESQKAFVVFSGFLGSSTLSSMTSGLVQGKSVPLLAAKVKSSRGERI